MYQNSNLNDKFKGFQSDPVPIKSAGATPNTDGSKKLFYTKGGDDNVYYSKSPDGVAFEFDRQQLRDSLAILKPYAHVPLKNLSSDLSAIISNISESLKTLYNNQGLYSMVFDDIRQYFEDIISTVKPGTVGAYFVGCFNNDEFDGPMGCNPKCAAALPVTEGTPGFAGCDSTVIIYSNHNFLNLNQTSSSSAYIYIDGSEDFSGFTAADIAQLKQAGITHAVLIHGGKGGEYREVTHLLPIEHHAKITTHTSPVPDNNSSNSGAAIGIIIIIIVIILILLLAYKYWNGSLKW